MRLLCIILGVFLIYQLSIQPSHAAESIIMRNITSSATITLRPNATLRRVMANVNERIYIENVERHGSIGRVARPPAALTTIMASINERVYIENVERHGSIGRVARPAAALITIMANVNERIYIEHVEQHQVLALHQLILDNGVPTGTVVRNIAIGTPTPTIQPRMPLTATATALPTDVPLPVTATAESTPVRDIPDDSLTATPTLTP